MKTFWRRRSQLTSSKSGIKRSATRGQQRPNGLLLAGPHEPVALAVIGGADDVDVQQLLRAARRRGRRRRGPRETAARRQRGSRRPGPGSRGRPSSGSVSSSVTVTEPNRERSDICPSLQGMSDDRDARDPHLGGRCGQRPSPTGAGTCRSSRRRARARPRSSRSGWPRCSPTARTRLDRGLHLHGEGGRRAQGAHPAAGDRRCRRARDRPARPAVRRHDPRLLLPAPPDLRADVRDPRPRSTRTSWSTCSTASSPSSASSS